MGALSGRNGLRLFRALLAAATLAGCTEDGSALLPGGNDGGSDADRGPTTQFKLRGRVYRVTGDPAPNALVYSLGGPNNVAGTFEALTDADGYFEFETSATRLLARHRFSEVEIVTLRDDTGELDISLVPTEQRPETLALGNVGMEMRFPTDAAGVYDYRIFDGRLHLLKTLEDLTVLWTEENLSTREVRVLQELAPSPILGVQFLDVSADALALTIDSDSGSRVVLYSRLSGEVATSTPRTLGEFLGATQDGRELELFFLVFNRQDEPHNITIARVMFDLQDGFTGLDEIRSPVVSSYCRSELRGTKLYFDVQEPEGFYECDLAEGTFRERPHLLHPAHRCLQWVDGSGPHGVIIENDALTVVHELEGRLQMLPRPPGPITELQDIAIQQVGSDVLVTSNFLRPNPFFQFNPVTGVVIDLRDILQSFLQFNGYSPAAKNDRDETYFLAQTLTGPERVFWDAAGTIRREPVIGNFDHPNCRPIDLERRDPRENIDVVLCNVDGERNVAFDNTGTRRSFLHSSMARLGSSPRKRVGDWVARFSSENERFRVDVFDVNAPR